MASNIYSGTAICHVVNPQVCCVQKTCKTFSTIKYLTKYYQMFAQWGAFFFFYILDDVNRPVMCIKDKNALESKNFIKNSFQMSKWVNDELTPTQHLVFSHLLLFSMRIKPLNASPTIPPPPSKKNKECGEVRETHVHWPEDPNSETSSKQSKRYRDWQCKPSLCIVHIIIFFYILHVMTIIF